MKTSNEQTRNCVGIGVVNSESVKHIKIDKPMPNSIKRAVEEKKEWIRKIQSGEMQIPNTKNLKRFA